MSTSARTAWSTSSTTSSSTPTQPGDTTIVLNEGSYTGYHLIYFVGPDEMSYHDCLADYGTGSVEGLRQPDYTAWHDELVGSYSASVNSFINWFAKV